MHSHLERPKRKLPTLLLMHVPKDVENEEIRHHTPPKQPVSCGRSGTRCNTYKKDLRGLKTRCHRSQPEPKKGISCSQEN